MQHFAGTPASCSTRTIAWAISGVGRAGLAMTVLPAISAAVTCPAKIASGKFHGLMQTNTPRPCSDKQIAFAGRALQLLRRSK